MIPVITIPTPAVLSKPAARGSSTIKSSDGPSFEDVLEEKTSQKAGDSTAEDAQNAMTTQAAQAASQMQSVQTPVQPHTPPPGDGSTNQPTEGSKPAVMSAPGAPAAQASIPQPAPATAVAPEAQTVPAAETPAAVDVQTAEQIDVQSADAAQVPQLPAAPATANEPASDPLPAVMELLASDPQQISPDNQTDGLLPGVSKETASTSSTLPQTAAVSASAAKEAAPVLEVEKSAPARKLSGETTAEVGNPGMQTVARPAAGVETAAAPKPMQDTRAADVAGQVARQVELAASQGRTSVRIQLNPQDLGRIDLRLTQTAQGLTVTLLAEHSATGRALSEQADQLRQALSQAGVNLTHLNINQQGAQSGQSNWQAPQQAKTPHGRFEKEAASNPEPEEQKHSGNGRFDYRV